MVYLLFDTELDSTVVSDLEGKERSSDQSQLVSGLSITRKELVINIKTCKEPVASSSSHQLQRVKSSFIVLVSSSTVSQSLN